MGTLVTPVSEQENQEFRVVLGCERLVTEKRAGVQGVSQAERSGVQAWACKHACLRPSVGMLCVCKRLAEHVLVCARSGGVC